MPTKPSWAWRIPQVLPALQAARDEWIDRRAIEELFGVSKTVAWRILRCAGVETGPGGALACRRDEFIEALERMVENGGVIEQEVVRRQRLDDMLQAIRPAVIANFTHVARNEGAHTLVNSRFHRLPSGIDLSRRELRISFSSLEDFLNKFGAVVFALNNDLEAIQAYIDDGQR